MTTPNSDLEKILAETTAEIQHAAEEIQATATNLRRANPLLWPLPWLAVLVMVIIFVSLKYTGNVEVSTNTQADQKEFPQMYMTDVAMQEFDAEGNPHYQLRTPLIQHFQPKNKSPEFTLMTRPHIVLSQSTQSPEWNITADEGRNEEKSNWFYLNRNVVAVKESQTQGRVTVNTQELRLNGQDQFAETDKTVTMRSLKSVVTAKGMSADMKKDTIKLLSQVKGTYEP